MADFLQNKYKEYSKRKRSAFRGMVKRAYTIVLSSYGTEPNPSSSDEDVEDVCDDVDEEVSFVLSISLFKAYLLLIIVPLFSIRDKN